MYPGKLDRKTRNQMIVLRNAITEILVNEDEEAAVEFMQIFTAGVMVTSEPCWN